MNLKHIEINIWKACNNKCRFCMSAEVWLDEKYLTNFSIVKKEIEKYSIKWYKSIWFLWWDISIHPRIFDIITEAKKNWFDDINIITNAMIFSDYKKAKKLIDSWTTRVNISIHSHIDEIENHLTQIKWWLERKLQAIDNFNKLIDKWFLKSNLSINIVLNWLNYKKIVETCLYFFKVKNINDIRINFLWNRFFTWPQDKIDLELKYSDMLWALKKLIYISLKYKLRITFDSIPPCIFYKLDNTNYKKIIKNFLWEEFDYINEVSNLNKDKVFNWKEQKRNELKIKFKGCDKCEYNDICEWVWKEYVDSYWEWEFICI